VLLTNCTSDGTGTRFRTGSVNRCGPPSRSGTLLIQSCGAGNCPKFYFQKTNENPDEFDVVDGQQRLTAIWEFMDGQLKLDADQADLFGGDDYDNLPEVLSDAFDDYEIEYDEITDASDEDLKEFFQRLQKGLPEALHPGDGRVG
jgi:hypothetical protein